MAQSVWNNRWFGWVMIGAFSLWYAWWCFHIPSPAKAATVLAVIAAIMAYRGEPEGFEKLFWTLVLFAFLFVELRAIDHKDQLDEIARQSAQASEAKHFSDIGEGIKKQSRQSQQQFEATVEQQSKQFAATMKIEQQNVNQITGGKSYAVVLPDTTDGTADSLPIGIVMCLTCEESIVASVYVQEAELAGQGSGTLTFQGQVNPHSMFTIGKISVLRGKEKSYKITVFARNKPTFEILKIRFNQEKKHWQFSYSITREEKQAHLNPKTQMAEGEVFKILVKETIWDEFNATPQNPSTITVH